MGRGKGRLGLGLGLVYLVGTRGLDGVTKYCVLIGPPAHLSRRTCVQTGRSRQTIFQKRCLVCQKLCRNILFGQSNGKVRDTDMSLIWQRGI